MRACSVISTAIPGKWPTIPALPSTMMAISSFLPDRSPDQHQPARCQPGGYGYVDPSPRTTPRPWPAPRGANRVDSAGVTAHPPNSLTSLLAASLIPPAVDLFYFHLQSPAGYAAPTVDDALDLSDDHPAPHGIEQPEPPPFRPSVMPNIYAGSLPHPRPTR